MSSKKFTLDSIDVYRKEAIRHLEEMKGIDDLVDLGFAIDKASRYVEAMKAQLECCDEY